MVLAVEPLARDLAAREAAAASLRALCRWAVEARGAPLPAPVRRRAALVLADDIAAMVAASVEPQLAKARAILAASGGRAEATVLAPGAPRATRDGAAAANGFAATWVELDEGYRLSPCHAGAYVIPALLADAEAADRSVDETLSALAVAYEITTRIARAYPFARLTIHPHAAFGAIGAAAGVTVLRGFDAETLFEALTAAATLVNAGPFNHAIEGALVRNLWTSTGAISGLRAADFAPLGIGGLDGALHDVFAEGFGCEALPQRLDADLPGPHWAIEDGYHKIYACCQYTHAAVQAAMALVDRRGRASVERIEVDTHSRGLALDVEAPRTVLAAKFSMPHAMAAVAVRGEAGPRSFDTASLDDPAIARLRGTVRLALHDDIRPVPNDRPGRVRWHLDDGRTLEASVDSARGGADQPFGEDELLAKFRTLTVDVFPAAGDVLGGLVAGGNDENPVRALVAALVAPKAAP